MACSFPIPAWQLENGEVVFAERGRVLRSLFLPCGRCARCRLERSRQWAVRCLHESKMHSENCFITLTYDDVHLPIDRGLHHEDFQSFLRRLRKRVRPKRFRYFMCGEYGESKEGLGRPHYHALLFGLRFRDQLYFKRKADYTLYTSKMLSEVWTAGNHLIGDVSFASAGYVARYCMEMQNGHGDDAVARYGIVDSDGVLHMRRKEYARMSLQNGGIGASWLMKYLSDVYPNGEVLVNGHHAKAPRYYDKLYKKLGHDDGWMSHRRYVRAQEQSLDNSDERLFVKEELAVARLARFLKEL